VKNSALKVAIESGLDFIGAILILLAAIIPAYLSVKLTGDLRKMTIALTAFIALHGTYHIVRMQSMEFLADRILEPASVMTLIAFGTIYIGVSYRRKKQETVER